jgi:hypothetical protein
VASNFDDAVAFAEERPTVQVHEALARTENARVGARAPYKKIDLPVGGPCGRAVGFGVPQSTV